MTNNIHPFVGLDIGTTSISLVIIDLTTGRTLSSSTNPHHSRIAGAESDSYILDPEKVFSIARKLVDSALEKYMNIEGIGITGQMHGIVILDRNGDAVSPAFTWLDMRAARIGSRGLPFFAELEQLTGVKTPSGFGGSTLFALDRQDSIPDTATTFCTIPDYVAMHLGESKEPLMDPSLAHSLGMFDIVADKFQSDQWAHATKLNLPEIVRSATIVGYHNSSIPVFSAIGDNQASFLGSIRDPQCDVLINIGTSGQICFLDSSEQFDTSPNLDVRPFSTGGKLLVGASLAGGKSFDVLAGLIRDIADHLDVKPINPYKILDTFIVPLKDPTSLRVETTFKGTRLDPFKTGTIHGVTLENLTIEKLFWAFADGIVNELYEMIYHHQDVLERPNLRIVATGNAIEKNPALRLAISKRFNSTVVIPSHEESAARGAAMIAMAGVSGGLQALNKLADKMIGYKHPD